MPQYSRIIRMVAALVLYLSPLPPALWRRLMRIAFRSNCKAQCVLVQAFGRNSYPDDGLKLDLDLLFGGLVTDSERYMALDQDYFNPGDSNRELARVALKLAEERGLAVIAQWEVAYAMWEINPVWCRRETSSLVVIWPTDEGYLTTKRVHDVSAMAMYSHGWRDTIELAHPAMLVRAMLILWRLGIDAVPYDVSIPYDWGSVQRWTKSWMFFLPREFLACLHHLKAGWVSLWPPR